MNFLLEEEVFKKSKSLQIVFDYLERHNVISVDKEIPEHPNYLRVKFLTKDDNNEEQSTLAEIFLENTQMKLLEDFFNANIMTCSDKSLNSLKNIYSNYVSSLSFSQRFVIKHLDKLKHSKRKETIIIEGTFLEKFGSYLEEKEHKILSQGDLSKTKKNLKEYCEDLQMRTQQRKQWRSEVYNEHIREENNVERVNEKINKVLKNLDAISQYKINRQLEDESVELFYQQKLVKNLKLHREFVEKRIISDIYSEEQIVALKSLKETIEKKINLLLNNKKYVDQRLKEVEKNQEDLNFVDVVAQISDLNKTIERRENQLKKLQNLARRFE